jgi:RNA polymerase sigma factor (sigma-70 family)
MLAMGTTVVPSILSGIWGTAVTQAACYRAAVAEEETLEVLMASYVAGELRAFDALYSRTSGRVFGFLMSMTGDRARAEDLCQATFLKLHRARAGWITGAPLMPWLMAIARNTLRDDRRKATRARVRLTASGDLPDMADPSGLDAALEAMASKPSSKMRTALTEALGALTQRQREAIVLTKQSGLSLRDAAHVLGTTETAVKLRVHRGYVALRTLLASTRKEEEE